MSNGHPASCPSCVRCEHSDCDAPAYCIDERPTGSLCPHDAQAVCEEHWPGTCPDCQRTAEEEMYASGVYDPRADPFFLTAEEERAAAYWASAPREVEDTPGTFRYQGDSA